MIQYKNGNLLDATHGIIMHGCNMQGVMGSGVAAQIKKKYPGAFSTYKNSLYRMNLGDVSIYEHSNDLWIANALTQIFYGNSPNTLYVSYDALEDALNNIMTITRAKCMDVHIPDMIGCGLANGDRNRVIKIIENAVHRNNFLNMLTIWKFS